MSFLAVAGPFYRGRTYNIRMEDQVLVRFTPRYPQPTYLLGDTVRGHDRVTERMR